jgi:hypothetical protein
LRWPEPLKGGFPPPRTHLDILVTVFAAANSNGTLKGQTLPAHLIAAALTGGAVLLALAVVLAFIVRPHHRDRQRPGWAAGRGEPEHRARTLLQAR